MNTNTSPIRIIADERAWAVRGKVPSRARPARAARWRVGALVVAVTLAVAVSTAAQTIPPTSPSPSPIPTLPPLQVTPPNGIDPVVIRCNGMDKLNSVVIPELVEQAGGIHVRVSSRSLSYNRFSVTIPIPVVGDVEVGVYLRTDLENVRFDMPVDEYTFSGQFRTGTSTTGKFQTYVDGSEATFSARLHARAGFVGVAQDILNLIPTFWRQEYELNCTSTIAAEGFTLIVQPQLKRNSAGNVQVDQFTQFAPRVELVSVSDCLGLLNLAGDLEVSLEELFGIGDDVTTVQEAATFLTNLVLHDNSSLKSQLRTALNKAIAGQARVIGAGSVDADETGLPLLLTYALDSFTTRHSRQSNYLRANWDLDIANVGADALPDLDYDYLPRPTQDPTSAAAEGDMQVFLPLSLFDKFTYELAQAGVLGGRVRIGVAGRTPAFDINWALSEVPRATAVDASTQGIRLTAGVALTTPGRSTVQLSNTTAQLTLRSSLYTNSQGLYLHIDQTELTGLTGSVRYAGRSTSIGGLAPAIRSAVGNDVSASPPLHLMRRTVNLNGPFTLELGRVRIGPRYVNVPLTILLDEEED